MDFKIDTKDAFSVISPATDTINAKMTVELYKKCAETRQNGSNNLIIDLSSCENADTDAIEALLALHEESYANARSLVFTGINAPIMATLKETEADMLLNIAPSMVEAVDIVSMEILERELLGEE